MENRNLNRDGVGLGLSVSQKIAKALGGEILVESSVGIGSNFTLRIPIKKSNASLRMTGEEVKRIDSIVL